MFLYGPSVAAQYGRIKPAATNPAFKFFLTLIMVAAFSYQFAIAELSMGRLDQARTRKCSLNPARTRK